VRERKRVNPKGNAKGFFSLGRERILAVRSAAQPKSWLQMHLRQHAVTLDN
jgi:hypothetical protein